MPRKDTTFSNKDVVRIANRNLTAVERREVILSLCKGIKEEQDADDLPPTPEEEAIESFSLADLVADIFSILSGEILVVFGELVGSLIVEKLDSIQSNALIKAKKTIKR